MSKKCVDRSLKYCTIVQNKGFKGVIITPHIEGSLEMGSKKGSLGVVRVLVVEDAQVARAALKIMLEEFDCQVVAVGSGHDAIEEFDGTFDVVFVDYNMPEMNGDKTAEMIRQKEKSLNVKKSAYIVGLSANNVEEIDQICFKAGMNQMIEKPIQPEILKKLLIDLDLKN